MKLILVDRDGVINEELPGYVTKPQELKIMPAAYEAFALLKSKDYTCVVVTNQSVVGRGIISHSELDKIHTFLSISIEQNGGNIDNVYVCTDRPDNAGERRKPRPGMLLEALEKYGAIPGQTPFIGDALTDLEAAYAAGCQRYLVMTGKGRGVAEQIPKYLKPVMLCTDILDAARKIVSS